MELPIKKITADPDCQSRVELSEAVAEDYAEALRAGCRFPPVVAFHDGRTYWLASGFHRLRAHELAGRKTILADVRRGGKRDAVLFSVGCNVSHGLRRSNADKRRAALLLLADEEWGQWSGREIARRCGVSEGLVRTLREDLGRLASAHETQMGRKAERGGTTYTMHFRDMTPAQLQAAVRDETDRHRPAWLREAWEGLEQAERALVCLGGGCEGVLAFVRAAVCALRAAEKKGAA